MSDGPFSAGSAEIYPFDAIIIGSGAGGSAAAYRLSEAGLRVLVLEKGPRLPSDGSTLDIHHVVRERRFLSMERWRGPRGEELQPEEHFNLGGKTKWYGAALLRFSPAEFQPEPAYAALGWPIACTELTPFYDEAERLLGARSFACEPDLKRILEGLCARDDRWQSSSLPMALMEGILGHAHEAAHFDGFASVGNFKGDADVALLAKISHRPTVQIRTESEVIELLPAAGDDTRIGGVRLATGETLRARVTLLAAGALHSPRLLSRYLTRSGLDRRLPGAHLVGRYLKLHHLTALLALSTRRQQDLLRKTMLTLCAQYPHSSVQPLGFDSELIATLFPRIVPRAIAGRVADRAYGFFLQTEDGSHAGNRIEEHVDHDDGNRRGAEPQRVLNYDAARVPPSRLEHRRFTRAFRGSLLPLGFASVVQRIGLNGTAHACGTLIMGDDARCAVVDAQGAVHGLKALYVVDGSVLPRSSRVNPALTIYAWSLRVSALLANSLQRGLSVGFVLCLLSAFVSVGADADTTTGTGPGHTPLVTAVDSVGIPVTDMTRSVDFYARVLGFHQTLDRTVSGDAFEHLFGLFGLRLRMVRMRLGDESVELMQFLSPQGRAIPVDSHSNDRWFQHVAIVVSDMRRAFEGLRAQHVTASSPEPQRLPAWNPAAGGIEAYYFLDPDGNHLELLHFPRDKGASRWHVQAKSLFLGIDHTAIVVQHTAASLAYYRDTLGFEVAGQSDNYGPEQERLNNVFGAHLHVTALRARAGLGIELLEYLTPTSGKPYPSDTMADDHWQWIVNLRTEPTVQWTAVTALNDYSWISNHPIDLDDPSLGYRHAFMLRDPDGHAINLTLQ